MLLTNILEMDKGHFVSHFTADRMIFAICALRTTDQHVHWEFGPIHILSPDHRGAAKTTIRRLS
jgi:hypothetical protein